MQHAEDWLTVRKAKRAPLTRTAFERIKQEADKAGLSIDDAVRIAAEEGWQGFRADWIRPQQQAKPLTRDQLRTVAAQTRLSDIFHDDGTPKDLTDGRTIDARAPKLLG